jgi:muramoyltetrapeptide carboxypeptidase
MKSLVRFTPPTALKASDKVAVVAPAGPFDRASFEAGLAIISERYRPTFDEGLFSQHLYFAGDDSRRIAELNAAFEDESVKAIFSARGGYGAMRLLPNVRLSARPKPLIGFSDITALHQLAQSKGWVSFHAPVLTQLGKQPKDVIARLFALLESPSPAAPLTGATTLVKGVAEGPLLGGNLSVLTRLLGTPYMAPLDGAVLLLEDVGERPYRLDRMWTHLELAGVFRKVAAIVLGDFTGCEEKEAGYTSDDILGLLAAKTGLPCARGFRIGHGELNLPVPLGSRVRLDATTGTLEFLEAAVAG